MVGNYKSPIKKYKIKEKWQRRGINFKTDLIIKKIYIESTSSILDCKIVFKKSLSKKLKLYVDM